MIFADTSIFVAAFTPTHLRHEASLQSIAFAKSDTAACAVHTLSEIFSVLTRRPLPERVPPEIAWNIVHHVSKQFSVVTLTATEHLRAIERLATAGMAGGLVYDAILLACARKVSATRIYTLNRKHFQRIAPDLASRIVEP